MQGIKIVFRLNRRRHVLRGGYWRGNRILARVVYRFLIYSDDRDRIAGFRLVQEK